MATTITQKTSGSKLQADRVYDYGGSTGVQGEEGLFAQPDDDSPGHSPYFHVCTGNLAGKTTQVED